MPRLKPLRLSDLLDRYRIEEPIDDAADREQWQDVAARDVLSTDDQEHEGSVPTRQPAISSSSDV